MKKIISLVGSIILMTTLLLTAVTLNSKTEAEENTFISSHMGWIKNGNTYNYINASGKKVKGWNRLNGLWYYFNSKGEMVKGIQTISNKKYLFNDNGSLNKKIEINKQSAKSFEENKQNKLVKRNPNIYFDKSGNPLGTGKKYISNASAYTGDTTTASGQRPRWGTIAVDPRVIPLGSRVYVPYFDKVFIANDTGGIIRGTMIDIFMKSARNMNNFGRRNLEIIVLD